MFVGDKGEEPPPPHTFSSVWPARKYGNEFRTRAERDSRDRVVALLYAPESEVVFTPVRSTLSGLSDLLYDSPKLPGPN